MPDKGHRKVQGRRRKSGKCRIRGIGCGVRGIVGNAG